jgi:hypothetical protein
VLSEAREFLAFESGWSTSQLEAWLALNKREGGELGWKESDYLLYQEFLRIKVVHARAGNKHKKMTFVKWCENGHHGVHMYAQPIPTYFWPKGLERLSPAYRFDAVGRVGDTVPDAVQTMYRAVGVTTISLEESVEGTRAEVRALRTDVEKIMRTVDVIALHLSERLR